MKITKRQLRRIIRERAGDIQAPAHPRGDLGKNIADVEFPIVVGYEGGSEIAYNQHELDDILDDIAPSHGPSTGIKYSLNQLDELEPEDIPVGANIEFFGECQVLITKRQLRKIIREGILKEYGNPAPPKNSNWRAFADNFDIGVLDLDEMAYDLGFTDFSDMDLSITPRRLAMRDQTAFITALQDSSSLAAGLAPDEILRIATASPGMRVQPLGEADIEEGATDVPMGWNWIDKSMRKYYR